MCVLTDSEVLSTSASIVGRRYRADSWEKYILLWQRLKVERTTVDLCSKSNLYFTGWSRVPGEIQSITWIPSVGTWSKFNIISDLTG